MTLGPVPDGLVVRRRGRGEELAGRARRVVVENGWEIKIHETFALFSNQPFDIITFTRWAKCPDSPVPEAQVASR